MGLSEDSDSYAIGWRQVGGGWKREVTATLCLLSSFLQGYITRKNRVARKRVLEERPEARLT